MNTASTSIEVPLKGDFSTLSEALDAAAEQFGDRDAYVEPLRRLSFRQWRSDAESLAAALDARGVGRGDVVAIMLPASIDYAVCCAAIVRLGAVATGINTRLGQAETRAILALCEPRLVIVEDGAAVPQAGVEVLHRSQMRRCAELGAGCERRQADPGDPVTIIWTSGTTGMAKGAWFDHRNLLATVFLAPPLAGAFDRRLTGTPFAHVGYMAKLWEQAAFGITLVISPQPWSAREAARSIAEDGITVAGAVPTQWEKLVALPETERLYASDLRICVTATAPASAQLVSAVRQAFHKPLIVRYAMTECPSVAGTGPDDPPDIAQGTVGRPLPGVEVRVCDQFDKPLAIEEVGRLQVRAPCQMRGYWNAPELTREAVAEGGWIRTGDMGRLTAAGYIVLTGRTSDMYIRGGYNVYPQEVEGHLATHPSIAEVCVVGVPAPVIGEIGVACVVPADTSAPPSLESLRDWCAEVIADYKRPDALQIMSGMPRNAMMKVDRKQLREMVQTARSNASSSRARP